MRAQLKTRHPSMCRPALSPLTRGDNGFPTYSVHKDVRVAYHTPLLRSLGRPRSLSTQFCKTVSHRRVQHGQSRRVIGACALKAEFQWLNPRCQLERDCANTTASVRIRIDQRVQFSQSFGQDAAGCFGDKPGVPAFPVKIPHLIRQNNSANSQVSRQQNFKWMPFHPAGHWTGQNQPYHTIVFIR
jgi:hypothetical protein